MNKLCAIFLVVSFGLNESCRSWEYSWILRSILSGCIGWAWAYVWTYNDLRDELLSNKLK